VKATRFIVLAAGILGLASFFLPFVAVQNSGVKGQLSAYTIVKGIDDAQEVVKSSAVPAHVAKKDLAEVNAALSQVKGIVLGLYAPLALLVVIGVVGLSRKKFGRVAGSFSFVVGLIGLAVAALLLSAASEEPTAESFAGIGMYIMLAAAGLGALAGLVTLFKPDRGLVAAR
jgi:hypothetical protein